MPLREAHPEALSARWRCMCLWQALRLELVDVKHQLAAQVRGLMLRNDVLALRCGPFSANSGWQDGAFRSGVFS